MTPGPPAQILKSASSRGGGSQVCLRARARTSVKDLRITASSPSTGVFDSVPTGNGDEEDSSSPCPVPTRGRRLVPGRGFLASVSKSGALIQSLSVCTVLCLLAHKENGLLLELYREGRALPARSQTSRAPAIRAP